MLRLLLSVAPLLVIAQTAGIARQQASITIDAGKVENEISPLLYGQFMEFMFEGIKGGLHAELLRDRGFEGAPNAIGLPRYWERYPDDRNDDYALNFYWDDTTAYPAAQEGGKEHSLRIDAGQGVVARHGLYQSRIPVRAGVEYHGYYWLKGGLSAGGVVVSLEAELPGAEIYAETKAAKTSSIRGEWRRYEFTLAANKSDPLARFAILVEGEGRLWLDRVSLMPGDAVDGVRADVFARVKALRPGFIRWPGGNVAQDYHWQWAIGPRDGRTTWANLSWKNEPEPSDFGTDEFIKFCRNVGAEPSITVNVEGRGATAQEAAAWVEYCNGPATSKYGAIRGANGHAEPYNVKFWEVGNEIWGNWVRGHSDAATYARNLNRYAAAMRAVDPSIKLIAIGDNDLAWDRTVLREAGDKIDSLAIHHYYGRHEMQGDTLNLMARPLFFEKFYRQVEQMIHELAPNRAIKLNVNEWGLDLPEPRQYSMEAALYGGRLMNVFERSGALVALSAVSDLINGWPGGIIQASRHGVFVTPTYLVNKLYSEHLGAARLAAKVDSPRFDSSREGKNVPYLDVVVSRSANGREIFIKAVNTDQQRPLSTKIDLSGTAVAAKAEMKTVNSDTLTAFNSFATPEAVSIRRAEINAGPGFAVELPAHSVSVIVLEVAR